MNNRRMVPELKQEEGGVCQHLPPPLRRQRQLAHGLEVQVVNGVTQAQDSVARQTPQQVGAQVQMLGGQVVRLQGGEVQANKPMDGMYSIGLSYSVISL